MSNSSLKTTVGWASKGVDVYVSDIHHWFIWSALYKCSFIQHHTVKIKVESMLRIGI